MQFFDFSGEDSAATTAKDFDMPGAIFAEQIIHIFKKFYMSALVGRQGDALDIFFDSCGDDFLDGSVMAEMDNFCTGTLQDPSHDIDCCIMAIKEGGSSNEPNPI